MLKFTKLFLSFVLSMMLLIANDDLSSNKKAIEASVKKHEKELIKISDAIWHNAELALEEYKSSKILSDYAEKNGFSIERGVAGMPTAFIATYGSGRPRIGILGEFDANAGISQKAQSKKEALIEGKPGHGCGHNLFGTGSLGAAIAVKELIEKGFSTSDIEKLNPVLRLSGNNEAKINSLKTILNNSEIGLKGIAELNHIFELLAKCKIKNAKVVFDLTLARGLNYYTGVIFEMQAPESVKIGSIGGGGRYDDLTGLFGVPNMPGVGISFGVDRIYDVLEELQLFPATTQTSTQVLFFNLGAEEAKVAFLQMQKLRQAGISCELYPEAVKFDKQFKYAERKKIATVIIMGDKEIAAESATVKNLQSGKQEIVAWTALSKQLLS